MLFSDTMTGRDFPPGFLSGPIARVFPVCYNPVEHPRTKASG